MHKHDALCRVNRIDNPVLLAQPIRIENPQVAHQPFSGEWIERNDINQDFSSICFLRQASTGQRREALLE